jgi:phage head maturation protease
MSTAETTDVHGITETPERASLVREFEAADLEVKGRTVDVRLIPFGEVARVADPPSWEPYDEEWLPGVFDHQLNAANRVHAKYGHSESVVDVVGHGLTLRSAPGDGYHISTKIHQTLQGETALELLRDGALPCVSLEAQPVRSIRSATGVVQRVKAHLSAFAFCRQGAFAGAQVLAIRQAPDVILDEELLPVDLDPEVVERCRRLGIALPQRYQAHPAQTDTPDETGTSEAAPAEATDPSETSEERDGRHEAQ